MKRLFESIIAIPAFIGTIIMSAFIIFLLIWVISGDTRTPKKQDINELGPWKQILLNEWFLGTNATPTSTKTITFNADFTVDVEFDSYSWEIRTVSEEMLVLDVFKEGNRFAYVQIEGYKPYKLWYSLCSIEYCETNRYFYSDLSYDGL